MAARLITLGNRSYTPSSGDGLDIHLFFFVKEEAQGFLLISDFPIVY